jgi:mono/diheme cytochrome c family protein
MSMIDTGNCACAPFTSAVRKTIVGARGITMPLLRRRAGHAVAVAAAAVTLINAGSTPAAHTRTTQVTWTADVQPIVEARCVRCHQTRGFGPMPLATYSDAKRWAPSMRTEVLSGRMPPWTAAPGYGDFANDARLSGIEAELLAKWADGGAPLGSPVVVPRRAADVAGAETMRIDLPAVAVSGSFVRSAALAVASGRDRWMTGWRFEPGDRSLAEEATLVVDGRPIGSWTPFDDRIAYPPRIAERLPKDANVSVVVRYRRTSEPTVDRSAVTMYFDAAPAHQLQHVEIGCGSHDFDREVDLLAVKPAADSAGAPIEVVAYGRDGAVTPLCVVSRYRPEYAVTYRLRTPIRVTRGSRVDVRSPAGCRATLDYVMP